MSNCILTHGRGANDEPLHREAEPRMLLCLSHRNRMTRVVADVRDLWVDLAFIVEASLPRSCALQTHGQPGNLLRRHPRRITLPALHHVAAILPQQHPAAQPLTSLSGQTAAAHLLVRVIPQGGAQGLAHVLHVSQIRLDPLLPCHPVVVPQEQRQLGECR